MLLTLESNEEVVFDNNSTANEEDPDNYLPISHAALCMVTNQWVTISGDCNDNIF